MRVCVLFGRSELLAPNAGARLPCLHILPGGRAWRTQNRHNHGLQSFPAVPAFPSRVWLAAYLTPCSRPNDHDHMNQYKVRTVLYFLFPRTLESSSSPTYEVDGLIQYMV